MKFPFFSISQSGSLAVLFFLLCTGTNCLGQQSEADLSEASLEQLGNVEVYSASRHLQPSGEAPSSVTIITANDIKEHGYRTLADILRAVRSFFVTYDRNYSGLGVRGFARPGDFNTRILILVDNHRLNDNLYDAATIGTEFPVDVDMIQRIEIVRGPASSLYGSNALFAVINIITKQPQDLNGLELSVEAASFNTYKGRISYGRTLQQFDFLISGSFYGSRGQNKLFFPEFYSLETNNGIASHADDDQLATALVTVASHGLVLQGVYGTREKAIPTGAYGTIFNNPGTRTTDSHEYLDLHYEHIFANSLAVLARAFCDRYTYQGTYLYPSPLDPSQISPNLDDADGKWWGTEIQVAKTILNRNHITAGGEYRDNIRQDQSNYNSNPYSIILDDRRKSFVGALYLQDELVIAKQLTVNAGFRYDYYSSVKASTDPRIALIYHPVNRSALKLVYGEAFRAPNVYEKYYSDPPNLPNPALRPETIRSTELVWEQSLSNRVWWSTTAFHETLDDLISQEASGADLLIFRNLQRVESDGLELELKGQLPHGFEGIASYSFQETKDRDTDQFLNNSPRDLAKLNLIQPFLRRSLFLGIDAQYRSGMETPAGNSISPFSIVNVNLFGRKIGRHADLSATLYNLLDKTYYDPPSTAVPESAIRQDGRSFRVKMTWRLGER
jgi:outer membrane receptor for ferrienterochelin and colicins